MRGKLGEVDVRAVTFRKKEQGNDRKSSIIAVCVILPSLLQGRVGMRDVSRCGFATRKQNELFLLQYSNETKGRELAKMNFKLYVTYP